MRTRRRGVKTNGYRSRFEASFAADLEARGIRAKYEPVVLDYTLTHRYKVDWVVEDRLWLEVKGYFPPSDRTKMLAVKREHPELDIRFVFQNASVRLNKSSKTTYAAWSEAHGFPWAEGTIPESWISQIQTSKRR